MLILPVPVIVPASSLSKLDAPFIAGTKNLNLRAYLVIALFISGLVATGMITYVGTVVDNLWAMYSVSEPTRLLSTFLPHGSVGLSTFVAVMPFIAAVVAIMIVASFQGVLARVIGFAVLVGLLSMSIMAFLPA